MMVTFPDHAGAARRSGWETLGVTAMLLLACTQYASGGSDGVSVAPGGHYFQYQGKPVVLLTVDHHYGAVIDTEFDYVAYLRYLGSQGMNLTRVYPGAMFALDGELSKEDPLGPAAGRQLLPWVQTTQPGAHAQLGGRKYDLDRWDEAYFARLRDFVATARDQGVIVDVVFFNGMYRQWWPMMALYHANNIQGVGTCPWDEVQADPGAGADLLYRQKEYLKEITRRLNDFDNVIYEIADEPWGPADGKWLLGLIDAFLSVEGTPEYPNRHLLGQTVGQALGGEPAWQNANALVGDPRIDWLPSEYVGPALYCLDQFTGCNKPIMCVETLKWPYWYPDADADLKVHAARIEAWEQVVGGAAGHITQNADFTRSHPDARNPVSGLGDVTRSKLVPQKRLLGEFIRSFDFARMTRNAAFTVTSAGGTPSARAIADPGHQYALYVHHSALPGRGWGGGYGVKLGSYEDTVTLNDVPAGDYTAEWISPETGAIVQTQAIRQGAPGNVTLTSPTYSVDVVLRMKLSDED